MWRTLGELSFKQIGHCSAKRKTGRALPITGARKKDTGRNGGFNNEK